MDTKQMLLIGIGLLGGKKIINSRNNKSNDFNYRVDDMSTWNRNEKPEQVIIQVVPTQQATQTQQPTQMTNQTQPQGQKPTQTTNQTQPQGQKPAQTTNQTQPQGQKPTQTTNQTQPQGQKPAQTTNQTQPQGQKPAQTTNQTQSQGQKPAQTTNQTQSQGQKSNQYQMNNSNTNNTKQNNNVSNTKSYTEPRQDYTLSAGNGLNEYISEKYKVAFKYPKGWVQNPRYEDKYEGRTGYFQISAFQGASNNIDQEVAQQIGEPYQPYGSSPAVTDLIIQGQPARLIYPSSDQLEVLKDREVALIVKYKKPVMIDGMAYNYIDIWSTREFMPLIIATLKFI